MKSAGFILLVLVVTACSSPVSEKPSAEAKAETKDPVEARNLLIVYKTYLGSLDSMNEKSVTLAAKKYAELFSISDEQLRDTTFVLFDLFYQKVCSALNEKIANDQFFSDFTCVWYDSTGIKELPFEKKYVPFRKSIEKNGFRIDCPEGMAEIGEDRSFLIPRFYKLVSPVMKEFLEGYRKEQDTPFQHDAGIVISEMEYVKRLIQWETFIEKNPGFIRIDRAREIYRMYFTFFLIGMDNTPAYDEEINEEGEEVLTALEPYYKTAYTYLKKKYPNSLTYAKVKPYWKAVDEKNLDKMNQLEKSYRKQGIMIDFSKDYNLYY